MRLMPGKMNPSDRTFALNILWVGFAGAWLLLIAKFSGFYEDVETIAGGVTAGSMIGLVFFARQDEYAQRLFAVSGLRACAMAGVFLFLHIIDVGPSIIADPVFSLIAIAATFHTAFAFLRIKGGV